jgi:hypothetical protein
MIIDNFDIDLAIKDRGICYRQSTNCRTCYMLFKIYEEYPKLKDIIIDTIKPSIMASSCHPKIICFKAKYVKKHRMLDFLNLGETKKHDNT